MHKKNQIEDAMNVRESKENVKSQKGVEMILIQYSCMLFSKKRTAN